MSRKLLVIPPDPLTNRFPSIGIGYLAASLLDAGHEVRVFDCGAPYGPGFQELKKIYNSWRPHVVGVGFYTETAIDTYQIIEPCIDGHALWVAGGVHATAVLDEPLQFGFQVSVKREGEQTIVALADLSESKKAVTADLERIDGIAFRDAYGVICHTSARERIRNIDRLPPPYKARHLFSRHWYLKDGEGMLPAMLLTSRGCPGKCIFCSREVTGRIPRVHSPERVVAEMQALIKQEGAGAFSFLDDAFTADRRRVFELCDRIENSFDPIPPWWCESRVDQMDDEMAGRLKSAGCCLVVFGVETGDPDMLKEIGKQVQRESVEEAFAACKNAGLPIQANMMFGFPEENVAQLENSLRFMERIAPMVSHFSPLGIPIPFPGTPLYQQYAKQYEFMGWWLDASRIAHLREPLPTGGFSAMDANDWPELAGRMERALIEVDFFHYNAEVKSAIGRCIAFRHQHNWGRNSFGSL